MYVTVCYGHVYIGNILTHYVYMNLLVENGNSHLA